MAKRKIVYALVKLSVAKHVTAAEARAELKPRVNEACCKKHDQEDVRVLSAVALHGLQSPDDITPPPRPTPPPAPPVGHYPGGKPYGQPSQYMTSICGAKLPLSDDEFVARCQKICGCKNRIGLDCDCVSIGNMASVELWTEHNTKGEL